MQTILIVYGLGLVICVLLGVVLSAVLFRDFDTVLSAGVSRTSAAPISRIIKLSFILAALVGGISAKFYSCQYRYAELIDNPVGLTMKVFGQMEGALRFMLVFLLVLAVLIAAVGARRFGTKGPTDG